MKKEDLVRLFKESANINEHGFSEKFKDLAAAITVPILQKIELESIMRQLFSVEVLEIGAQAEYPIADDLYETPVWMLPTLGYMAQNFIEGFGESVVVPTFEYMSSADWAIKYAQVGRINILQKAINKVTKEIIQFEEDSGWRVIVPAATTAWPGRGLVGPRPAAIYEMNSTATGAGYLSKYLINKMITGMHRNGRRLTDLYISPEDAADIREWTDTEIDPITRREVFQAAGMGKIWNVQMNVVDHLGAVGLYNINGFGSEYGKFVCETAANTFNNYSITNPNVVNANGQVTTVGETQVYGFDLSVNDSLVMPIKEQYKAIEDPTLIRKRKQGFFGHFEAGFACLDSRMLCMAVIDRSVSENHCITCP